MKIAFLGTRGIPNTYGGFEQFISYVAPMLIAKGHEVCVYTSSRHKYKGKYWKGVEIVKKPDMERAIGKAALFFYDLLCILDARKRKPDVIFQLGYTSSSIWSFLFPRCSGIITNMDGLEWKRSKYNFIIRVFLKFAEKLAIRNSHMLIADSMAIRKYLYQKYGCVASYIPYGADLFSSGDPGVISALGLIPYEYDLIIARCVPENQMETVIHAYQSVDVGRKLLIIGWENNRYGRRLLKISYSNRIIFKRGIYDMHLLNNLRYYSHFYFHGHSAGGTNPSLLEAMACRCFIIAHDNEFNKEVLRQNACYFKTANDIKMLLKNDPGKHLYDQFVKMNLYRIQSQYSWENIIRALENLLHVMTGEAEVETVDTIKEILCA